MEFSTSYWLRETPKIQKETQRRDLGASPVHTHILPRSVQDERENTPLCVHLTLRGRLIEIHLTLLHRKRYLPYRHPSCTCVIYLHLSGTLPAVRVLGGFVFSAFLLLGQYTMKLFFSSSHVMRFKSLANFLEDWRKRFLTIWSSFGCFTCDWCRGTSFLEQTGEDTSVLACANQVWGNDVFFFINVLEKGCMVNLHVCDSFYILCFGESRLSFIFF